MIDIKKIHYCWFGRTPKPSCFDQCFKSWCTFFPDYEIIEWNESNYDFMTIDYTREAYEAKKFAFVSDYARLDILYQHGGIYFDIDVEVLKPFGDILLNDGFAGMDQFGFVATGLVLGCKPGLTIIKEMRDDYLNRHFKRKNNSYDLTGCPAIQTDFLQKKGYKKMQIIQKINGMKIYPAFYFCPKSRGNLSIKTSEAYTIHYGNASWQPTHQKIKRKILSCFGENVYYLIQLKKAIKKKIYF